MLTPLKALTRLPGFFDFKGRSKQFHIRRKKISLKADFRRSHELQGALEEEKVR